MKVLSLFFLLALVASAIGLKVRDLHIDNTVVTVSDDITPDGAEHLLIEIDRIEDDVSDDGLLLAERDIRVAVAFTFDQNLAQVVVNDVPAPFGYSELSVQAQIIEVTDGVHVPLGQVVAILIRLNVFMGSITLEDGRSVSAIKIQERVVGIQTSEVWQADVIQQTLIFQEDGSVVRFDMTKIAVVEGEPSLPAPIDDEDKPHHEGGHHGNHHGNHHHGQHHGEGSSSSNEEPKKECAVTKKMKELFAQAEQWFHSLSFPLKVLVSFAGGVFVGFVVIGLLRLVARICCGKKCCSKVKDQPVDYKANIKVYSLQYTQVPQEEKDEKKGSIQMV